MKPVKINHKVRDSLKEYSSVDTTYDGIINRLIHEVADNMPVVDEDLTVVNIHLHEDTMGKLKAFRLSRGESYENILVRMLLLAETLNNSDE